MGTQPFVVLPDAKSDVGQRSDTWPAGAGVERPGALESVRAEAMLEFDSNTLAFMTAALEQACRQLKNDTPAGRQFIASKLKECASGQVSAAALTEAAEDAVAQLNGEKKSSRAGFLKQLFRPRPNDGGR